MDLKELSEILYQEEVNCVTKLKGRSGESEDFERGFSSGLRHVRENILLAFRLGKEPVPLKSTNIIRANFNER